MTFNLSGQCTLKIYGGFWNDHGGAFDFDLLGLGKYQSKPLNDGEYQVEARLEKGSAKYSAMGSSESFYCGADSFANMKNYFSGGVNSRIILKLDKEGNLSIVKNFKEE